jgi:predicted metal-dependent peptidase
MTKVEKLLAQAKVSIIREHPFFASILLRRPIVLDPTIPTACITPKAEIKINPKFIENMSVRNVVFLLCHEVLHVAGLHFMRQGARDHAKWNWATDAWINKTLMDSRIGDFISGGVTWNGGDAAKLASEQLYANAPNDVQKQMTQGIGMDLPADGAEGSLDSNSSDGKAMIAQIKIEVGQAANVARAQGSLSGALKEFTDQLLAEKIDWFTILAQYMNNLCASPIQSWSRPNKRFAPHGFYLPSAKTEPALEHVVVQFDVSGSITSDLMSKYISHVENVLNACSPRKTTILWVDTEIKHSQTIEWPENDSIDHFVTYGGTDMEYGIKWVQENEPESPDAMIIITDGETGFNLTNPAFPIIWVIDNTREIIPPYGITIRISDHKD